jgi:cellulose synthase (UDP-forming)
MTEFRHRSRKPPRIGFMPTLVALAAVLGAGALLIVPLPWKEQAILGASLIGAAILLDRISTSHLITLALIAISMFSTLRYGYFRVTQTWDGITSSRHLYQWDTIFVVVLLFAEFYAFITLALGYFQTLRPLRRRPVPLAGDPQTWPTVDVFVPTYNEPLSVVRTTVFGALALDYPVDKIKVFVLDDGRRKEFYDFANRVGAGYITRNNNRHAKAGNINHALQYTRGEYVAIFDSDHVPTRSFLQATLGWFLHDRRLGMVQTPHHFYSPDPFERNLGQFRQIPNEGELFHRLVQDGNDLWNASFFCGSCAVLSRTALDQIGGIAVETVTEDAHTALRMQRRGWSTAYINIPQAAGLATETLAAHIGQRIRWARGMVQILRMENPLFARGLSLSQRLCYFNATTHFLFALPRLIFLTIPLLYLLFGMVNIYGYSLAIFAYALPHIVLSDLTNSRIQGRHRFSFWNEIYEAVLAPYILLPTLLALINPRLGKFNVTSKGGIIRHSYFDRRIALPFLFLLMLNIAGLFMAERRYVTDPAHHDTVMMNAVWTIYNIMILSAAASVAWEKRQRRSHVRVEVRTPCTLITAKGQRIMGMTAQLSRRGTGAVLDHSLQLPRGAPVVLLFDGNGSHCEILARVVNSSGRRQNLLFPELNFEQERYLVNLVYSRPEAWLGWRKSEGVDRPLKSLVHILWLALRGFGVILVGLFTPRPIPEGSRARAKRRQQRAPAVIASVVLLALPGLTPLRLEASAATPPETPLGVVQPAGFHESYELSAMGAPRIVRLESAGASQNLFFGVPVTKVISSATLSLHYSAPMLRPNEARLELTLNGTRVGAVALSPGTDLQSEIALPTDLLTTDNTLSIQLQGNCAACLRTHGPWVAINARSEINLGGTKLPLKNDLSLLPIPFFDPAAQRSWALPIVFSSSPSFRTLQAAAAITSWFGAFSDVRGVRFPVSIGELPEGNAVVFALRNSELAARLSLPSQPGALIAMRDNPRDPYGKLLIVAGERPDDLLTAARALVTRNHFSSRSDVAYVHDFKLPTREEYSAPRWLQTDEAAPIGMYTTDEHLKLKGSGSINVYFRLPPDLFLQARQSVSLLLKYSYAGVAENSQAALHVRLNAQDIDSLPLKPSSTTVDAADLVRLPTGRLKPYTNTLTIDFDFRHNGPEGNVWQFAAIHRDSSIDFGGIPHSVLLPRLELFADAGYPFTQSPDLARTAVVMPDAPTAVDYEALLDMVGFFGAQTGSPATAISVTDTAHVDAARDKDIVVLGGGSASQNLLSTWAASMPLVFSEDRLLLNESSEPSRLLHPKWPFRERDRKKLSSLLARAPHFELILEDFVSPLRPDRTVVAIVPGDPRDNEAIATLFMPSTRIGPVYGGVAVSLDGRFQSFLVGNQAYHSGQLDPYWQGRVFLFENYWLIPLLVVLLAFMIALWLHRGTEVTAARRLAAGKI